MLFVFSAHANAQSFEDCEWTLLELKVYIFLSLYVWISKIS